MTEQDQKSARHLKGVLFRSRGAAQIRRTYGPLQQEAWQEGAWEGESQGALGYGHGNEKWHAKKMNM